jgi:hypothetical protein
MPDKPAPPTPQPADTKTVTTPSDCACSQSTACGFHANGNLGEQEIAEFGDELTAKGYFRSKECKLIPQIVWDFVERQAATLTRLTGERDAWSRAVSRALEAHEASEWSPQDAEDIIRELSTCAKSRTELLSQPYKLSHSCMRAPDLSCFACEQKKTAPPTPQPADTREQEIAERLSNVTVSELVATYGFMDDPKAWQANSAIKKAVYAATTPLLTTLARLTGSLIEAQEKRAHFQVANFELLRKLDAAEADLTRLTGERRIFAENDERLRTELEGAKQRIANVEAAFDKAEADLARAIDAMEHHQRLEASYKESWQAAQADLARLTQERDEAQRAVRREPV